MSDAVTDNLEKRPRLAVGPMALLIAGNAALAMGPWLVRLTDVGPVAAGFWRLTLALPLIAVFAWGEDRSAPRRVGLAGLMLVVTGGVFFALDLASWHIGIERTRMANATLFGNSGAVILMIWALIVAWRRPRMVELLAVCAAIGGALILMDGSLSISPKNLAGDLFSLLAGLFYAAYLISLRSVRSRLGPWQLLVVVCVTGAPVLLGIAALLGEVIVPHDWGAVALLALSSQVVGQGLLIRSLGLFSPLVIGVALLTQPALAALIGYLAFGETVSVLDVAGMAMVGSALVLARLSEAAERKARG